MGTNGSAKQYSFDALIRGEIWETVPKKLSPMNKKNEGIFASGSEEWPKWSSGEEATHYMRECDALCVLVCAYFSPCVCAGVCVCVWGGDGRNGARCV